MHDAWMARLFLLLFFLQVLLTVLALISCLSAEDGEVRALPRPLWVIVILLVPLIGSIAYYMAGRPLNPAGTSLWRSGIAAPESTRPRELAPDDDPEFLAGLGRPTRSDPNRSDPTRSRPSDDRMRQWEEDLRSREEDLRRRAEDLRKREETPPADG
jgi:hypothetical protein